MAKKKKDNSLLWLVLIGAGGVGLYYYLKNPATVPAGSSLPSGSGTTTTTTTAITSANAATSSAAPAVSSYANNPLILKWASDSLKPGDYQRFAAVDSQFTPAEWQGLYLLVTNDATAGWGTAAGGVFWDAWRTKYGIDTGLYA